MLRALVLGIVLASGAACDKSAKQPPAQVDSPAGRVVELTGKVEATRGGTARVLIAGADVFRDDTIDTGADGSVTVELFHNNAVWAIEGRKARVDESQAWTLAKQTPLGKPVDHATSSAGRDAERQGAGTRVTADQGVKASATTPQAAEKTGAKPDPAPGKGEANKDRRDKQGKVETRTPPKPEPVMGTESSRRDDPMAKVKATIEAQRTKLRTCVGSPATVISINVSLDNGVATIKVTGVGDAKAKACVENIVKGLPYPVADLDTTIVIK